MSEIRLEVTRGLGLQLEVVTPSGRLLMEVVQSVVAPSVSGEMGVLASHRPAVVQLGGGAMTYAGERGPGIVFLRGGMAEVRPTGVLILAEEAKLLSEVDQDYAKGVLASVEAGFALPEFLTDERVERLTRDRRYAEAILSKLNER